MAIRDGDVLAELELTDAELQAIAADVTEELDGENAAKKPLVIPSLLNLATVEPEEVDFLWRPYIPRGKLTLLEGDPGLGKTFLSLNICAAISRGWPLPGPDGRPGEAMEPGNVLFMSAEDGIADTLVPRLEKAGADRSRIYCLTGWRAAESEEEEAFSLQDVNVLREALEQVRPALVVIDPLQGYIGGIDMHRANEVRPVLSGVAKLAEEFHCAVLAIRHLSKSGGSKAVYRGLGSIDFTAAARSVLLVGQDPKTDQKAMIHTKSSCAENGKSLGFEINNETGFTWTGLSNCTAEDLLTPPGAREEESSNSALEDAKEYLQNALEFEPVKAETLLKNGPRETGVSKITLRRAKKELDIKSEKRADGWYWFLPTSARVSKNEFDHLDHLPETPTAVGLESRLSRCSCKMCEPLESLESVDDPWLELGNYVKRSD